MKKNTLIICSRRTKSAPRLHNIYQTLKVKYDIFIAGIQNLNIYLRINLWILVQMRNSYQD